MHCTDVERPKAKKPHRCMSCGEGITVGETYVRWRCYDGGHASTNKMHPECLAMHQADADKYGDREWEYSPYSHERPMVGHERSVRQHTPGPWVADKVTPRILDGEPYWRVGVVGGTCLYVGCGDEHEEADAHLIAAAPDLLSALRDLEAMAERYRQPGAPIPDAQKKARAAIAKAVGRAA